MKKLVVSVAAGAVVAALKAVEPAASCVDLRVPEDSPVSVAVDFDAMRREMPDFLANVRKAVADGRKAGWISEESEIRAYKGLDAFEKEINTVRTDCGFGPEDIHSLVYHQALPPPHLTTWLNKHGFSHTAFAAYFGAEVVSTPLAWDRIAAYAEKKGWVLNSDTNFGLDVKCLWPRDTDTCGGPFVVSMVCDAADGRTFFHCSSPLWEIRHGKRKSDPRPSRNGTLEPSEVVRVVVCDLDKLPQGFGFLDGIFSVLKPVDELRLSIYLADGSLEVRSCVAFRDDESAATMRQMVESSLSDIRSKLTRDIEGMSARNDPDAECAKTALGWLDGVSIATDGRVIRLTSGRIPLVDLFGALAEPLAEAAGEIPVGK